MLKSVIATVLGIAAALGISASPTQAQDTLAKIKAKSVVVVGIKNDYKPWGFLDPTGKVVGMEIDLAQEVGQKLGVKVELLPVIAANRMEFLKQGRIDLMIATMGDTPERRKVVGMVEPNYYAGGTNVLALKSAGLKQWKDLAGKKVCAVQGAYYNRRVTQLYSPELVVFPAVPDALNALQGGNCVAFLFDKHADSNRDAGRQAMRNGRLTKCRWCRRSAEPRIGIRPVDSRDYAVRRDDEGAQRGMAQDRQADRAREEMGHQAQSRS